MSKHNELRRKGDEMKTKKDETRNTVDGGKKIEKNH
jgi:hypothetical protein